MKPIKILEWLALPAFLIALWWFFTRDGGSFFVPTPTALLDTFVDVWLQERIITDVLPSALRLLIGLLVSFILGVSLGTAIGLSQRLRWALEPVLEFVRATPSTVMVPVLLLIIGINDTMRITVIVLGCLFPILLNTIEGVRSLDEVLRNTGRVFGLTGFNQLRYLTLPGAMPQIMAGVRHSLAVGLILMVVSEMFASTNGIGHLIVNFQNQFQVPEMWSGIVLLGILGVLMSLIFQFIQKRVLHWYFGLKEASNDG